MLGAGPNFEETSLGGGEGWRGCSLFFYLQRSRAGLRLLRDVLVLLLLVVVVVMLVNIFLILSRCPTKIFLKKQSCRS